MPILNKEQMKWINDNNFDPKRATMTTLLKVIRYHCLECVGGSAKEVEKCAANNPDFYVCPLWAYRMGNPVKSKKQAAASKKLAERNFDL